jgi:hypothetical protein
MRRVALFAMAALSGLTAFGQGLLDCVEPDVLRALLPQGQGQGMPVITGEVPQELAALRMPGSFSWIGSAERIVGRVNATTNASQVSAAWRSSLAPEAARVAAAAALTSSGWQVQPPRGISVFTSAASPFFQAACRDRKAINFNTSAMEGATYVLVTLRRGDTSGDAMCNQPASPAFSTGTGLDAHLPRLDLPVDPATGVAALLRTAGYGSNGNSGRVDAHAEFTIRDSAGNIARHLARQMAEQGWISDAEWSGTASAGSSWSKALGDGVRVHGSLSVTALEERQYVAVLRLGRLP